MEQSILQVKKPMKKRKSETAQTDRNEVHVAADGEKVIIHDENGVGFRPVNAEYISRNGLETAGGTHGIVYTSTGKSGYRLAFYSG